MENKKPKEIKEKEYVGLRFPAEDLEYFIPKLQLFQPSAPQKKDKFEAVKPIIFNKKIIK